MRMTRRRWRLVVATLVLNVAGSASAISLLEQMETGKTRPMQMNSSLNCVDFSGHWVGTCEDPQENTFEDAIQIDQVGCTHFRFNQKDKLTETYEIGEAKRWGKTTPSTNMNTDLSQIALWSASSDILIISISGTSNNLVTNEHWKEKGNQRFAFRAGKLHITTQIDREGLVNGATQTNSTNLICRYNKQQ